MGPVQLARDRPDLARRRHPDRERRHRAHRDADGESQAIAPGKVVQKPGDPGTGGAAGPWVTGFLHDLTGSYGLAFAIGIAVSAMSALAIWMASPRKIRAVAGQLHRTHARTQTG